MAHGTGSRHTLLAGLLAIALAAPVPQVAGAPILDWTRQLGTSQYDWSNGVSADALGNVYISGQTLGSLGGPNAGSYDAFLTKYDSAGTLLWSRQVGTASRDRSNGVSADGLGNAYISGWTEGSLGGPNAGSYDAFLRKYDAAGTLLWSRQIGTASSDVSYGVSADGSGNVYISGSTYGSLGGPKAGSYDAFLTKYDAAGTLLWSRQVGTASTDRSNGVSADGLGNVYISGYTLGSLGGPNAGNADAFLTKYDAAGTLLWSHQVGTALDDVSNSVSADGLGNVYISGQTRGSLGGPNAGNYDAFLTKYDSAGTLQWSRQVGTAPDDVSYGVSADGSGNVYISGYTHGSLGGPKAGPVGLSDAFLTKYDSAGTLLWNRQIGTASGDTSSSVSADGSGNVYISGWTGASLGGPNAGGDDAFVAKFVEAPAPPALLFRMTTGSFSSLIPGFTHVGFFPGGDQKVWESTWVLGSNDWNPLTLILDTEGEYWDPDAYATVHISPHNGVQQQQTLGSWQYAGKQGSPSPVTDLAIVPIDSSLAQEMSAWIAGKSSATYSVPGLVLGWLDPKNNPWIQKGYGDDFSSFTCVGLIEGAAEQVGWRTGQGFIPNRLEVIPQPYGPGIVRQITSLTPQMLYWAATYPDDMFGCTSWFQGILDPVDFIITDPLGRRFGYTAATGLIDEIPGVLYSGNADVEQFFISAALPGAYSIELFGLGQDVFAAFGGPSDGTFASQYLGLGDTLTLNVQVDSIPEPSSLALMGFGLAAMVRAKMRHRRKRG